MPSLVKVRSFLGVAEAELARIRLAMDGIAARVSNAEFVSWAWWYSNATGGVKLFVNQSDALQAAIILSPQPVPPLFQPPEWHCPKCRADVDGLWSFCWSCGTSKNGEEDPDFHTWYRESGGWLVKKSFTEVISVIISVFCLAVFLAFNKSPFVLLAWLITLPLWVLISRFLSLHNMPMFNAAEVKPEPEHPSPTDYDPSCDDFKPADDIAYKLWKAVIFSIGRWSFVYFAFALWLWFKTNQNTSLLSAKSLRHYYYSLICLIICVTFYGWYITYFYLSWMRLFHY
jgi:hypothetical protein